MQGTAAPVWSRLRSALGEPDVRVHAGDAQAAATLALLRPVGDDIEIVFTRRRDDLRTHPGQISFPGGRLDQGESEVEAALREAAEEVALEPSSVTVLGALPSKYVVPSQCWLQTIVARWDRPHPLVASEAEVAEILTAHTAMLADPTRWRRVQLAVKGWSWAWQLDGGRLLWGATAVITARLLDLIVPGWSRGTTPGDLGPDRDAQPWLGAPKRGRREPWLPDCPSLAADAVAGTAPGSFPDGVAALEQATAEAVRQHGLSRVVVLAGGGGNGRAGAAVARRLARDGCNVAVVTDRSTDGRELDGFPAAPFDGRLPPADLYVDALVGRGLDGPLRGRAHDLLLALRRRRDPVLALDVPSGLHAERGLIGPCIPARAVLTLGRPAAGLLQPRVEPYVGDIYLADDRGRIGHLIRAPQAGLRE